MDKEINVKITIFSLSETQSGNRFNSNDVTAFLFPLLLSISLRIPNLMVAHPTGNLVIWIGM